MLVPTTTRANLQLLEGIPHCFVQLINVGRVCIYSNACTCWCSVIEPFPYTRETCPSASLWTISIHWAVPKHSHKTPSYLPFLPAKGTAEKFAPCLRTPVGQAACQYLVLLSISIYVKYWICLTLLSAICLVPIKVGAVDLFSLCRVWVLPLACYQLAYPVTPATHTHSPSVWLLSFSFIH